MENKKLPPLEVIKEMYGEGREIPDEILDAVAGGAYTYEEWFAMTEQERKELQLQSIMARDLGLPCDLD